MAELQHQRLSPDNPWPGLDPFDETDRDYFHGREEESGELLRLVRREPLTVLFGRSGLGKTSLLKAGLFPLLRAEDGLPVYVRLDHGEGAPILREQVFRALRTACDANRIQAARPAGEESLWSFFHRRDAEFWSDRSRPVTPVIVFDQLEEIFTLGQETEESRARSAAFLAELGDLVENRPPDAVREALEADPTVARRFDFKRSTVKLALSFREDFLAELEGLKEQMPSLMYNRFRLLAMNGARAYEVITCAGGSLVDDDVARRIIRLAWKNEPHPPVALADFPKIEIDPALLSVVCSELNHKRQHAALDRITPVLLEGADREILSGFYERGMAGLDPRVRAFVEDELITDRGFRDSHALEDALALPGVTSAGLDSLIRRRLLRVDERQSVRRLELTHDVLARVVKESRDSRRAREAEEAVAARERAAREQQRRNRRLGALLLGGAFVVIGLALLAGWFAWKATRLLREAEITQLRGIADQLREADPAASLLVNLEALRAAPTLEVAAGLLRRFAGLPHLSSFLWGHKEQVSGVAFSPDGKLLASASHDQTVILWDVARREPRATLRGHRGWVVSVAFSPDGKRLASAGGDQTVILWDIESARPLATLKGHKGIVNSVAFSPDGKLASGSHDRTVILWDLDRQRPQATLTGHKDTVFSVAFSPDGKHLASGSWDHTVILWDVDGRKLATLDRHTDRINEVAFSPDSKLLASASFDQTVILWDVASRRPRATLQGHRNPVLSVSFNADRKRLATGSRDQTVMVWDLDSREPLVTLEGHKGVVWGVVFSPDGKLLASGAENRTVILWEKESLEPAATLEGHKGTVFGAAFSPDGKRLASASWDNTVIVWDVHSRKPIATLDAHKDLVYSVVFSPDGKRLASAGQDQTVILWDVATLQPITRLRGHEAAIYGLAFSPDGKRLATAGGDLAVILWDVDRRKPLAILKGLHGHKDQVNSVVFSPDGKRLASTSVDQTVILWDVASHQPVATLKGNQGETQGVAFSPDGKRLVSTHRDHTMILWDVASHQQVATLKGHRDAVLGVAFSPDGKRLASASSDQAVILWDVASHRPLATLKGHKNAVESVAFSPDGQRLASASRDKTVILWNLDLRHLMAEVCRRAHRNLTCEEWRDYIGVNKSYRKTCPALPGPEACE